MHNSKHASPPEFRDLPFRMTKGEVAYELRVTPASVDRLRARDTTFPKAIKDGDHRRARVYFVRTEIQAYLLSKLEQREVAA